MSVVVCTLFEKDYHHGVAVLVNSLVRQGFAGSILAGFRGNPPPWAADARPAPLNAWPDARAMPVGSNCQLLLLPMDTDAHFTNVKPDFMLQVLDEPSIGADSLLYLDPDIVVTAPWQFMVDWMSCGIALCEDVNSPLAEHHPRRVGWRRHFADAGIRLDYRGDTYVNGGCVGVSRADRGFLEDWRRLGAIVAGVIGGSAVAKIEGGAPIQYAGFASCFDCSDQDALNAAIEFGSQRMFSILPRVAMGFAPGTLLLPHAIGPRKPWRRRYLREAASGLTPTAVDKAFWKHVDGPIASMSPLRLRSAPALLAIASAIGRFYQRQ